MKKLSNILITLGACLLMHVNCANAEIKAKLDASRTSCVSPCTVIFSAIGTTDTATPDEHDVFKDLGYHFTFGDPDKGNHSITNLPRNSQIGGPMATHTFICNSGQCTYNVGVRAENTAGAYDDHFITVIVDSADYRYSAQNTICVSTSSTWHGDKPCPPGATQQKNIPSLGSYSGKRVLLRRGERFGGNLCIGYRESNVLVESFGDENDPKPELINGANIGVLDSCSAVTLNTAQASSLPARWAENITLNDLRILGVSMGMSYHQVGLHDLDMDYYDKPDGGFIELSQSGKYCADQSRLDCAKVPYPNGIYISDTTAIGSNSAALNGSGHGVLISGYNCPMINWVGIINTTFWNSNQHQLRLEGAQRISFSHNNARGHTKGNNSKHTVTLRSCGPSDIDIQDAIVAGTGRHRVSQGSTGAPWTRWAVFSDNTHGSADATNPTFKLQIAPTNVSANEALVDVLVERATYIHDPAETSIDLALNGYYLTARVDSTYTPETQNCKDIGAGSRNPVRGEIDCEGAVPSPPNEPFRAAPPLPPSNFRQIK